MKKKIIILIVLIIIISLATVLALNLKKNRNEEIDSELSLKYEVDYDLDEDVDGDGLTNVEEKKYGTDAFNSDTDLDGLFDNDEITIYKTDPLKTDTDGDGLTDFNEVELGFDPLKQDTNGDGKKDSDEHATYRFEKGDMIINVSGKGNIADTYAYIDFTDEWESTLNREYSFSSKGDIDELKVSFIYTKEELEEFYIDLDHVNKYIEDNPNLAENLGETDPFTYLTGIGVCKINKTDSSDMDVIKGVVDIKNQTITSVLDNYEDYYYIIGDIKDLYYIENNSSKSKIDKSNHNLILIADSGFDVMKDGFSFKNYCTNFAKYGHCYGMALFADLYYTNDLPLESDSKSFKQTIFGFKIPFTFHNSYAYNLSSTYFSNHSNLYDYELGIKFSSNNFDEEKMQTDNSYNKTDVQLLNAIYQLYTMQGKLQHFCSGGILTIDGLYNISTTIGTNKSCNWDGSVIIDLIAERLKNAEAPILCYAVDGGQHAVNVIRLYRYNNDNKYRVCIYNNNNPGEEKWLDIEMGKKTCTINSNNFFVLKSPDEVPSLLGQKN